MPSNPENWPKDWNLLGSAALKKALVFTLSFIAFGAATVGVYKAIHSPLFLLQVVEVTTQNADRISLSQAHPSLVMEDAAPLNADQISELAAIPLGAINLFDLDLSGVEKRLLKNEWIREVKLQKRFPQTLSITAVFKEPKAILSLENGAISYVDIDGKAFGKLNLMLAASDSGDAALPLLTGFESENISEVSTALQFLSQWSQSPLGSLTRIESLNLDPERGYRAMLSYELKGPTGVRLQRTRVDLGLPKDLLAGGKLAPDQVQHLVQVFQYLRHNSVAARQIYADVGKKIVVKTAHGS